MTIPPTETALFCASCSQRVPGIRTRTSDFLRRGLGVCVSFVVHPQLRNPQITSTFSLKVHRDLGSLVILNQGSQSCLKRFREFEFRPLQTAAVAVRPLVVWKEPSRVFVGLLHETQSIS